MQEITPHNQKRTLPLAALALVALLCICGAIAYTVGTVPADNVLSFGSVKVRVCEYTLDRQGREVPFEPDARGEYPETKASSNGISRIVRLQNAGAQPEPGAVTENLMDSLRFTGDFHDAARGGRYKLEIAAQAVQAKNQNTDDAALDVLDVAGWPEAR